MRLFPLYLQSTRNTIQNVQLVPMPQGRSFRALKVKLPTGYGGGILALLYPKREGDPPRMAVAALAGNNRRSRYGTMVPMSTNRQWVDEAVIAMRDFGLISKQDLEVYQKQRLKIREDEAFQAAIDEIKALGAKAGLVFTSVQRSKLGLLALQSPARKRKR